MVPDKEPVYEDDEDTKGKKEKKTTSRAKRAKDVLVKMKYERKARAAAAEAREKDHIKEREEAEAERLRRENEHTVPQRQPTAGQIAALDAYDQTLMELGQEFEAFNEWARQRGIEFRRRRGWLGRQGKKRPD